VDEYNSLVKATEKLHELYYQQDNSDIQFSNARARAQNHLISSGLSGLVNATAGEIIYSLEGNLEDEFLLLHDAAITKSQLDAAVLSAEEFYRYASQRYEDCIKNSKRRLR
jgi:hypothetical protein